MDCTRLFVQVEKYHVLYDSQYFLYKDLKTKEKTRVSCFHQCFAACRLLNCYCSVNKDDQN